MSPITLTQTQVGYLVIGGLILLYVLISQVGRYARVSQRERTRREALAYIAEGAMTVEQATRVIGQSAGSDDDNSPDADPVVSVAAGQSGPAAWAAMADETRRELFKAVAEGGIESDDAERLARLMPIAVPGDDETPEQTCARLESEHRSLRDLFRRVGESEIEAADAERLWNASRRPVRAHTDPSAVSP